MFKTNSIKYGNSNSQEMKSQRPIFRLLGISAAISCNRSKEEETKGKFVTVIYRVMDNINL